MAGARLTPCHELWAVERPTKAERAILDLSVVLHRRGGSGLSAVGYEAQVIAYSFFEQFGLEATLAEIERGA